MASKAGCMRMLKRMRSLGMKAELTYSPANARKLEGTNRKPDTDYYLVREHTPEGVMYHTPLSESITIHS